MDKELIKGLIAEYQQFVKSVSFVKRAVTLSDNFNYVFVGLRRVGKSYLMYQQIQVFHRKRFFSLILRMSE